MKRMVIIGLCVALLSTLAFGAGKQEEPNKAAAASNATLRFFWYGGDARNQATIAAINKYVELHPNVKIEPEYMVFDGFGQKLFTQLAGGTAPDVFQFSSDWLNDVMSQGSLLVPLDGRKDVDLSNFPQSMLDACSSYQGHVYAVPSSAVGYTCIVNNDFFAKNGISVPQQATWKEFQALGKQVHDNNPRAYLTTADIDMLNRLIFGGHVAQSTGLQFVDDSFKLLIPKDKLQASLEFVLGMYKSNTVEPFDESTAFVGKMEQNPKWLNGEIGVLFDITTNVSKYKTSLPKSKVTIMNMPVVENAKMSGVDYSGSPGWSIYAKSKYVDEAAKFVDWISNSAAASVILGDVRGVPASKSAYQAYKSSGKLDPQLDAAIGNAQVNSYTINLSSKNPQLMQIRKDVLQKVVFEKETPAAGAQEIVDLYAKKAAELKK
jgi:oligogalacturonide transport system substrate-binding protein